MNPKNEIIQTDRSLTGLFGDVILRHQSSCRTLIGKSYSSDWQQVMLEYTAFYMNIYVLKWLKELTDIQDKHC